MTDGAPVWLRYTANKQDGSHHANEARVSCHGEGITSDPPRSISTLDSSFFETTTWTHTRGQKWSDFPKGTCGSHIIARCIHIHMQSMFNVHLFMDDKLNEFSSSFSSSSLIFWHIVWFVSFCLTIWSLPWFGRLDDENDNTTIQFPFVWICQQVRGILNKLTPENFEKLSDELLKIELGSKVILKGVILLIFQKALDELKYSRMYAQLCKRLSIEAQNFENSDKNKKLDQATYNSTFLSILLSVCRDKFENRSSDCYAFSTSSSDTANSNTSPIGHQLNGKNARDDPLDEEERKYIAKQKMLGNVKFIAELFTLEMLDDKILHKCIKELLSTSPNITQKERCENMECLSQIIRTCGKLVDAEKVKHRSFHSFSIRLDSLSYHWSLSSNVMQSKTLMDQYFERIDHCSQSTKYPPRIRFMLRDLIELRRNGWVPRKSANTEAPVPMQQLRPDDDTRFNAFEPR